MGIDTKPLMPYELVEDIIGAVDSGTQESASTPRRTAFGAYLVEKHNRQLERSAALTKIAIQQGLTPDEWVRRNFQNGRNSQGRSLSEVLDMLLA